MSTVKNHIRNKENHIYQYRLITMVMSLMLLTGIMAGCGRKSDDNGKKRDSAGQVATSGPSKLPEPTITPSPTPTPIPFIKQTYETYGRGDVYRLPFELPEGESVMVDADFAGDYVLLWYYQIPSDPQEEPKDVLILIKPGVSTTEYRDVPDFSFSEPTVLKDGTVILKEWETGAVHIYDNSLKELRSFTAGKEKADNSFEIGKDGTIWTLNEDTATIRALDLNGQIIREFSHNPDLRVVMHMGNRDNRECFLGYSKNEDVVGEYLYLSAETGQITYLPEYDPELGSEWLNKTTTMGEFDICDSASTWFLVKPGCVREGIAFPKGTARESIGFLQEKKLCGFKSRYIEDKDTYDQEFRLYDTENRTVSEALRNTDLDEDVVLSAKGIVSDTNILLLADHSDRPDELLLWTFDDTKYPISGFCDFINEEPEECLKNVLKELKEKHGTIITPDRKNEEETAAFCDIMREIEFVNNFMISSGTDAKDINNPENRENSSDSTDRDNSSEQESRKTAEDRTRAERIHPENMNNNDGTEHIFKPHVFSGFYLKEHGEKIRDVFFAYVDALRAGEDRFKCPDIGSANWASGRLAIYFYPVGAEFAYAEYAGNGWADITYKIPKEEFLEKAKDFEDRICSILNDVVEEDYTDLEKALALYEFMTEYCVYDYEMLAHNEDPEWSEKESGYRVLMEKQGICWEISCLYRYLLLQCGVEAEDCAGAPIDPEQDMHAWTYITLDGQGYLIDPTWGLTDSREPDLAYFLFTDEMRENRDGYESDSFDIGGYGLYGARKKYSFEADDDRYSDLWEGKYIAFDQEKKIIFYWDHDGDMKRFVYGE